MLNDGRTDGLEPARPGGGSTAGTGHAGVAEGGGGRVEPLLRPVAGSLFSGIGGLDCGLARAGWDHAFLCESDPWRREVLHARFPGVPVYDDVREVGTDGGERVERDGGSRADAGRDVREAGDSAGLAADRLADPRAHRADAPSGEVREPGRHSGAIDLLCGGFPCQDLSVAGKRAGLDGARSGLFHEFARIASVLMPKWILLENVPGLLSSNDGADFLTVLDALQNLGYIPEVNVLDSRFFGVPQRRRRVFILCTHVETGRKAKSPTSVPMLAQALFELSALTLVAQTAASITAPGSWESRYAPCVDGLRRRMTLFGITSTSGWNRLLDDFIVALRKSASERETWVALSESARFGEHEVTDTWSSDDGSTASVSAMSNIESSLRKNWADLFTLTNECITSTSPRATTDPRTSTCAEIALTISECIAPLTRSFPLCWNADSSGLTAREVVTSYARQTSSSLFGDMDGVQFWLDAVERADRIRCGADGDPRAAAERAGEILAVGSRCPGHPATRGETREDVAVASLSGTLGGRRGFTGDDIDRGGALIPETAYALNAKAGYRDGDADSTYVASTLKSQSGRGWSHDAEATYIAAPLSHGSNPNSNAAGRRREDDYNLVAEPTAFHMTQDPISGDVSPAMGNGNKQGCATIGVNQGASVRRLTPTECERLQGLPDVCRTVRIVVWNSSGHPANDADAESQNLRSLSSVWPVEDDESEPSAKPADPSSRSRLADLESPVAASVLISSERNEVVVLSPDGSSMYASGAGDENLSRLRVPAESFAHLTALMLRGLENSVPHGRAASPLFNAPSGVHQNGAWLVHLSGPEIAALASGVETFTTVASRFSKSTTSEALPSFPSSDSTFLTLCSCVATVIAGCIPEITPTTPSFAFDLHVISGWTRLDDKTPDSRRYAALGDAVTANVGEWLGRRLAASIAEAPTSIPTPAAATAAGRRRSQ